MNDFLSQMYHFDQTIVDPVQQIPCSNIQSEQECMSSLSDNLSPLRHLQSVYSVCQENETYHDVEKQETPLVGPHLPIEAYHTIGHTQQKVLSPPIDHIMTNTVLDSLQPLIKQQDDIHIDQTLLPLKESYSPLNNQSYIDKTNSIVYCPNPHRTVSTVYDIESSYPLIPELFLYTDPKISSNHVLGDLSSLYTPVYSNSDVQNEFEQSQLNPHMMNLSHICQDYNDLFLPDPVLPSICLKKNFFANHLNPFINTLPQLDSTQQLNKTYVETHMSSNQKETTTQKMSSLPLNNIYYNRLNSSCIHTDSTLQQNQQNKNQDQQQHQKKHQDQKHQDQKHQNQKHQDQKHQDQKHQDHKHHLHQNHPHHLHQDEHHHQHYQDDPNCLDIRKQNEADSLKSQLMESSYMCKEDKKRLYHLNNQHLFIYNNNKLSHQDYQWIYPITFSNATQMGSENHLKEYPISYTMNPPFFKSMESDHTRLCNKSSSVPDNNNHVIHSNFHNIQQQLPSRIEDVFLAEVSRRLYGLSIELETPPTTPENKTFVMINSPTTASFGLQYPYNDTLPFLYHASPLLKQETLMSPFLLSNEIPSSMMDERSSQLSQSVPLLTHPSIALFDRVTMSPDSVYTNDNSSEKEPLFQSSIAPTQQTIHGHDVTQHHEMDSHTETHIISNNNFQKQVVSNTGYPCSPKKTMIHSDKKIQDHISSITKNKSTQFHPIISSIYQSYPSTVSNPVRQLPWKDQVPCDISYKKLRLSTNNSVFPDNTLKQHESIQQLTTPLVCVPFIDHSILNQSMNPFLPIYHQTMYHSPDYKKNDSNRISDTTLHDHHRINTVPQVTYPTDHHALNRHLCYVDTFASKGYSKLKRRIQT